MARRQPRRGNLPAARHGTIGQPSKLTDRTEDAIIHAVLQGNHLTTAASAAGIGHRTLYNWLERADAVDQAIEEGKPYDENSLRYLQFRQRLADARAQAEMRAVQVIQTSMAGGHLVKETPLQNINGDLVYGPHGEVMYDRTYTAPDGRLALSYLGRSRPMEWGQNTANRVELTGQGGGPVQVEHSGDQIASLSARLEQVLADRRAEDEEEAYDADIVEDGDG